MSWGCENENERTTSPVLPKFGGGEDGRVCVCACLCVSNGMDQQSCPRSGAVRMAKCVYVRVCVC